MAEAVRLWFCGHTFFFAWGCEGNLWSL